MKKLLLLLVLSVFAFGCSSSEEDDPIVEEHVDFKLTIDDTTIKYPVTALEFGVTGYKVYKKADIIYVEASYGNLDAADSTFDLDLSFSTNGTFITGVLKFNSFNAGSPEYKNYINFPANYFSVTNFELDETNKKIKLDFNGKLYLNKEQLTSEARNLSGKIDMNYIDGGTTPYPLLYGSEEQYCTAKINSTLWKARFLNARNSFTAEDAYKFEFRFTNTPAPTNYNFDPSSTTNCVRFSKFNPSTLTYDYYNVTGLVGYTTKEYHGTNYYCFTGTFSFTAVNPNNPSDVVTVTDGVFRSLVTTTP